MKVEFTPVEGAALSAGQSVNVLVGNKVIKGLVAIVPDGAAQLAQVQIPDDSPALGAKAKVQNAGGNELGSGKLEANRPLLLSAYSGSIDKIYVKLNDVVKANRRLVRLEGAVLSANFDSQLVKRQQLADDLNRYYADLAKLTVVAPADGVVTGLALKQGAAVQEGTQACAIQSHNNFKLVVAIDELDIPKISLGQKADVKIDALAEEKATAEVIRISPVGVKVNDVTTYDVTLKVTAPAKTLSGMNASADVEVAFKADTLLVPVEAIETIVGKTYVFGTLPGVGQAAAAPKRGVRMQFGANQRKQTAADAQTQLQRSRIAVKVGLINDTMAEILEGLAEGDEVAVPQVESTNNMMTDFGGGNPMRQSGQVEKGNR
jgi:HlyD family secretion protein